MSTKCHGEFEYSGQLTERIWDLNDKNPIEFSESEPDEVLMLDFTSDLAAKLPALLEEQRLEKVKQLQQESSDLLEKKSCRLAGLASKPQDTQSLPEVEKKRLAWQMKEKGEAEKQR